MVVRTLPRTIFGLCFIALLPDQATAHRFTRTSNEGADRRGRVQGSWSDDGFRSEDAWLAAGYGRTTLDSARLRRGYVNYDLSGLRHMIPAGYVIVKGSISPLSLSTPATESAQLRLFDVATPPALLQSLALVNDAIYDDLGSGTIYGTTQIPVGAQSAAVQLNTACLATINANLDGSVTFGVSLDLLSSNPLKFGVQSLSPRLEIEYGMAPEPSGAVLATLAVLGGSYGRRRGGTGASRK